MYGNYYQPYPAPDALAQYKAPYQVQQPPQQQGGGLLWVQGEAGAKSFLVAPGQSVLLMDSEAQRFYLKSADNSGMPSMRVFEYTERTGQPTPPEPAPQYVTWEALEERLAQLAPAKKTKAKEDPENE